jgi:type IV pilus assembly protein PilY1
MKMLRLLIPGLLFGMLQTQAAITDIATSPLVTSATTAVLPNVMFILDDSGSMDYEFLPDWAGLNVYGGTSHYCKATNGTWVANCNIHPPYKSGDFNGVAYNPAITYSPPTQANGSTGQSMDSAFTSAWTVVPKDAYRVQDAGNINLISGYPDTVWCTDNTQLDCVRNDNYIVPGTILNKNYLTYVNSFATGRGDVVSGTPAAPTISTRDLGPYFYTIVPGEWCDSPTLRNCSPTQSGSYTYPAPIRWCSSDNAASAAPNLTNPSGGGANICQSINTQTYNYLRFPNRFSSGSVTSAGSPARTTFAITLSGCGSGKTASLTGLFASNAPTVNLLSYATTATNSASNIAAQVAGAINSPYYATASSANVTLNIQASSTATLSYTSVSSSGCSLTLSPNVPALSGYVAANSSLAYYGRFIRTDIVPSNNSYPYPGTATKAATRTDCGGATCNYAEEMTNFANWYAYYHTRMQMMKTSTSIAFSSLSANYRVGWYTINNNNGTEYLNLAPFTGTQKTNWYAKLFAANPNNSTPLRGALSTIGRLYAGRLNSSTLRGTTVVDPMQYSCQQNFTILSTDGYWNETSNPVQLNGTTAIGDQDSTLQRPQYDGTATGNTLADVAAYYYNTDLRTASPYCTGAVVPPATSGNDVCNNNVPPSALDGAAYQHMTTFTLGLGASGYMQFTQNYNSASNTSGDYFNVKNGSIANAGAGVCFWQTSGACNWPVPVSNTQTTIDDLWHAAVNGYGTYFSATNPALLSTGLASALSGVISRQGAAAAATTSNPNIVSGDNYVFSSHFVSVNWTGELTKLELDLNTGAISPTTDWSAQALLDANTNRTIYTYDPSAGNRLKLFTWNTLGSDQNWFNSSSWSPTLSQLCSSGPTCLASSARAHADGRDLVDFLRGVRTYEGPSNDTSTAFRQRSSVLGDIVNSEAVYIKKPPYNYADSGYSGFKAANATRQGMVYVGANDGMLHAFNADTGVEAWAYIPSLVLPDLYKLADKNYATTHRFYVDGSPIQGDVYFDGAWHTILVGGLGAGGRGFYALDVTDPANPQALWEFTYDTSKGAGYTTDANLGLSFGRAEISKLRNGTWVVILTSGYNNVSPGDGNGHLYVLNAKTGTKLVNLTAPASGGSPSGLAQVRAWSDSSNTDNTVKRVYGGDLQGNLWRFDIDDQIAPSGNEAIVLATLKDASGNAQPMSAKPELGDVDGTPVVYVGTGKYIGVSDLVDSNQQSIYAVKDALGTTGVGNPRLPANNFIKQTLTVTGCPANTPASICSGSQLVRTSTNLTVNWAVNNGWYVDLVDSGERANTDPELQLGTLLFTTNVPNVSACTVGGNSYLYYFNYKTGGPVATSPTGVTGIPLGNELATRPVYAKLPNNKVIALIQGSAGNRPTVRDIPNAPPSNTTRRVSWRELFAE